MVGQLPDAFSPYGIYLSVAELADGLGITVAFADDLLNTGQIPCYRIGVRWLILRDEVREFIKVQGQSDGKI